MNSTIIGALIGAVAQTLGSLFEKLNPNETRKQNRINFIAECRAKIDDENFEIREFIKTSQYSRLRNYLPESLIEEIEPKGNAIVVYVGDKNKPSWVKTQLLIILSDLERKWKLL